ncbi:MAG TPA: pyridoxamine 5'-phosphate oxidase family protein [Caulobacteraceae bacterium]|nr:pyridoxamine 5'-phosphate oxidase family protein [Caulobacteraceae bacterium]
MAIELNAEIREHVDGALMSGNPMIMASVDEAGRPRLSFRGSVAVFGPDSLGVWARNAEGQTVGAVGSNPHVALMYRHPAQRVILQFAGRARLAEGAERDQVYANAPEFEQKADPEKKGVGLIIDLDKVEGLLGLDPDGNRRLVRMER